MSSPLAVPISSSRFLQGVIRSGLLDAAALERLLADVDPDRKLDAAKLAQALVERGSLTPFQASKLTQGSYLGLALGPFQILTPLGRGGMGAVYLARNTQATTNALPALIALKVLPPKRAKQESRTLARFLREMEMARLVGHPHVARAFQVGEIDGVHYIAMEYIRGRSLSQLVKSDGTLSAERAAFLFSEVAEGLAHAHERGLIHRDLKPSNIMITPNDHAKILDLGLAMSIDEELPQDSMIVGGQGYVVGTMDYIAPEQVDDPTAIDARADLYSLGCSIYFSLTGQPPFAGGTSKGKMKRHRVEFAEPIPDLNPTVPLEFAHLVDKLMEKNPAKRYRSADDVRRALRPWADLFPGQPLDVDPMMSEAEAVAQAQQSRGSQPSLWWQEVPAITFEATAKHQRPAGLGAAAEPMVEDRPWAGWQLAFLIAMGLFGLVMVLGWLF
jgi:serine/threonine protein kinase